MTRGEIYRTRERSPERGGKPGFYVVASRSFIAEHPDIATVVCAPIYGEVLGLTTEVVLGPEEGLPRTSAARGDFLMLMFKSRLTNFIGSLPPPKIKQLDSALATLSTYPPPRRFIARSRRPTAIEAWHHAAQRHS